MREHVVFPKGAFFGQVLMFPEHYGAGWLTEQQVFTTLKFFLSCLLDSSRRYLKDVLGFVFLILFYKVADFLHFWRVNGWYLGVKDENNAALDVIYLNIF